MQLYNCVNSLKLCPKDKWGEFRGSCAGFQGDFELAKGTAVWVLGLLLVEAYGQNKKTSVTVWTVMDWALSDRHHTSTKVCIAEFWHSWVGHRVVTAGLKAELALPLPSPPTSCCTWIACWSFLNYPCSSSAPVIMPLSKASSRGLGSPTAKHQRLLAMLILTPLPRHMQGLS